MKVFSIKERYTDKIYRREKLAEFRRQNVSVEKDERCLIYTTSPVKKITGFFTVKSKLRMPIETLWRKTKNFSGLTKKEFDVYFQGCVYGTAIVFEQVKSFVKAISLQEIRKHSKSFMPPQSYYSAQPFLLLLTNSLKYE